LQRLCEMVTPPSCPSCLQHFHDFHVLIQSEILPPRYWSSQLRSPIMRSQPLSEDEDGSISRLPYLPGPPRPSSSASRMMLGRERGDSMVSPRSVEYRGPSIDLSTWTSSEQAENRFRSDSEDPYPHQELWRDTAVGGGYPSTYRHSTNWLQLHHVAKGARGKDLSGEAAVSRPGPCAELGQEDLRRS
jgi:hypothetical protein